MPEPKMIERFWALGTSTRHLSKEELDVTYWWAHVPDEIKAVWLAEDEGLGNVSRGICQWWAENIYEAGLEWAFEAERRDAEYD